jgi:hypothetical protein
MESIWECHKMDLRGKTMNTFIAREGKRDTAIEAEDKKCRSKVRKNSIT